MSDPIFSVPPVTHKPRSRAPLRYALLASVSLALLVGGPLALENVHGLGAWAPQAQAVETAPPPVGHPGPNETRPVGFADIVAKVKPAVISVRVKIEQAAMASGGSGGADEFGLAPGSPFQRFFRRFGSPNSPNSPGLPKGPTITGVGSGFFISPDGYAVTNNHVVDHADTVTVTADDGTLYTAKVIGTDPATDVALIKVDANKTFPYVKFADAKPRIGDWVVAVGNPFGLGGTVTAGIVSAQGRDIGSGPYDDFIQIDAPMNKGNSGGPSFDMNGDVIGINTAIFSPSGGSVGIGFDVPADTAKTVVAQLKDKGQVVRGWIGVQVQPVTADIADSLGMNKAEGALVAEPQSNSPASKAGIKAGDVITALNGAPIKSSRELAQKISAMAPGTSAKLDILRSGENKSLTLTLGKLPATREAKAEPDQYGQSGRSTPQLGLSVAPAGEIDGAGPSGVVVTGVDPNGAAAEHGFRTGDIILDVGGKAVANADDIRSALDAARSQGRHDVLMRVKTADAMRFVALPIGQG
jgi:serine protease Do